MLGCIAKKTQAAEEAACAGVAQKSSFKQEDCGFDSHLCQWLCFYYPIKHLISGASILRYIPKVCFFPPHLCITHTRVLWPLLFQLHLDEGEKRINFYKSSKIKRYHSWHSTTDRKVILISHVRRERGYCTGSMVASCFILCFFPVANCGTAAKTSIPSLALTELPPAPPSPRHPICCSRSGRNWTGGCVEIEKMQLSGRGNVAIIIEPCLCAAELCSLLRWQWHRIAKLAAPP